MKFDQRKRDWVSVDVDDGIGRSYFPIRLRYEGDDEDTVIETSDDIDNHRSFRVLETRLRVARKRKVRE